MASAKYANGTNYGKSIDPSSENIIDPGLLGGKIRVFQDYATISASSNMASSDYVIVGGKLPIGSQVVKIILGGVATTLGSSSNVIVGDEGDNDRYMSSVSCAASKVEVGPNVATGMYYAVTGTTDNYIRVTTATNGSIVSSGTIKVSIFYVVE
jgi:hypothetical protein